MTVRIVSFYFFNLNINDFENILHDYMTISKRQYLVFAPRASFVDQTISTP